MFSHIMVGSNDIARSKKFYDALQMYLAYLRDPDGNKLVGLYRMPAA